MQSLGAMLTDPNLLVQVIKTKVFLNYFYVVGGGLPVVQKQPLVQKKLPWQQDKIAHNPLDSTSPLVKKGKQREVPKAKKPTPLKKVRILTQSGTNTGAVHFVRYSCC